MSEEVAAVIAAASTFAPAGTSTSVTDVFAELYGSSGAESCVICRCLTVPFVSPQTRDWKLLIATLDTTWIDCEPAVALVTTVALVALPTNTSTGRCAAGAAVPALSCTSPWSHWPTPAFETSAVIVSVWLAPGASVNFAGVTVRPRLFGFTVAADQVALAASELVTVRVHVQVASQPELARLASLSVVGSPPADGSAAV